MESKTEEGPEEVKALRGAPGSLVQRGATQVQSTSFLPCPGMGLGAFLRWAAGKLQVGCGN